MCKAGTCTLFVFGKLNTFKIVHALFRKCYVRIDNQLKWRMVQQKARNYVTS